MIDERLRQLSRSEQHRAGERERAGDEERNLQAERANQKATDDRSGDETGQLDAAHRPEPFGDVVGADA